MVVVLNVGVALVACSTRGGSETHSGVAVKSVMGWMWALVEEPEG